MATDSARSAASTAPGGVLTGAARLFDYWAVLVRRTWKGSVASSFVTPLLYVLAMGVLLGGFIKGDPAKLDGATSYLAFVAPGLVSAQAMTTVFAEVTYPVMGMIKWNRAYFAMVASPLRPTEIAVAHLAFTVARVGIVCAVFQLVLAPFGVYAGVGGAVLAFLVQLLLGLAFAAPLYALTTRLPDEQMFSLVFRFGMIPMFLFSGAFFPIRNLDGWMQVLAQVTPLWHGVDLTRMLTVGNVRAEPALVHLAYLIAVAALGTLLAVRNLRRRLIW